MIDGLVVDAQRLNKLTGKYAALDETGDYTTFISDTKPLAYRSQAVTGLGLYPDYIKDGAELSGAKKFFMEQMQRQDKIVQGNKPYHYFKPGVYNDIVNWDFKSYYVKIFEQICNHVDETYFGKEIKSIARKNAAIIAMRKNGTMFSEIATTKPMVDIEDIAANSIKIDANNNKDEFLRMVHGLSQGPFVDEIDGRVSKIVRNALTFGFGYQQKHAKINNISALVMFFASELLKKSIQELMNIGGYRVIYSHTDSFMVEHLNTKDLDQAIRTASGLIDAEYFGNTEIISMGFNNLNNKAKYEDLLILNQNSYIASTVAPRRRDIHLKIAGLNTLSECALGIDKQGNTIQDFLWEHIGEVFSNKQIQDEQKSFLYSVLKHRLSPEYEQKIRTMWSRGDSKLFAKAVIESKTIKFVNYLKREIK